MLSRRIFIGPALLLLLLFAGYSAYWYIAGAMARDRVLDWAAQQRADGYAVDHGAIALGGFPTVIRLAVPQPAVGRNGPDAPYGQWQWRAPSATLELQPWNLRRYRLEIHGPQDVAVTIRGTQRRYRLASEAAVAVARFHDDGRLAEGEARLRALQVADDAGRPALTAATAWVRTDMPADPPADHHGKSLKLALGLESVTLPQADGAVLGRSLPRVQAVFELMGVLPSGPPSQAIEAWRQDGGTVEIPWLNLVWGPLDLRAKGTATLDRRMRPLGALTADIRGYRETLSAFASAGLVPPDTALAAGAVLELMAHTASEDGARVLTVPLTAQHGALFVGPVRLLTLSPIPVPRPILAPNPLPIRAPIRPAQPISARSG